MSVIGERKSSTCKPPNPHCILPERVSTDPDTKPVMRVILISLVPVRLAVTYLGSLLLTEASAFMARHWGGAPITYMMAALHFAARVASHPH